MLPSAERLSGMTLDNGWRVLSSIPKTQNSTGGNFSVGYLVEAPDGKRAFLKALDYSGAFSAPDPAIELQAITEAFNFERNVLAKCKDERLDHVVTAITDGTVRLNNATDSGVVQYLIFELADGDVRKQANLSERFDIAWSLRSLHNVAVGLQELHYRDIAHQDLKPSNVLIFKRNISKVADFGRAAYKGHVPPHENLEVAGDPTYAPVELLYGYIDPEWNRRRLGCDLYLLGSMAVYFFLGAGVTTLILKELPEAFHWKNWGGTFDDVLPYINDAFQIVLEHYQKALPASLQNDLTEVVGYLCEPDPRLRGHPKNRTTYNKLSLERFVSKFNLLAKRAELKLLDL